MNSHKRLSSALLALVVSLMFPGCGGTPFKETLMTPDTQSHLKDKRVVVVWLRVGTMQHPLFYNLGTRMLAGWPSLPEEMAKNGMRGVADPLILIRDYYYGMANLLSIYVVSNGKVTTPADMIRGSGSKEYLGAYLLTVPTES